MIVFAIVGVLFPWKSNCVRSTRFNYLLRLKVDPFDVSAKCFRSVSFRFFSVRVFLFCFAPFICVSNLKCVCKFGAYDCAQESISRTAFTFLFSCHNDLYFMIKAWLSELMMMLLPLAWELFLAEFQTKYRIHITVIESTHSCSKRF